MKSNNKETHTDYSEICGEELEYCYCVGPLNLNKLAKRACTAMGVELFLDEKMFDVLDMLASRVGDYFTPEELCEEVYGGSQTHGGRELAHESADNLLKLVGAAGHGFMWIEYLPESGYAFKTHWGHNWKTQSTPVMQVSADEPTADELTAAILNFKKRQGRYRPPLVALVAGAVTVAAAIILAVLFLLNAPILQPADVAPAYAEFEDPRVPLASYELEDD